LFVFACMVFGMVPRMWWYQLHFKIQVLFPWCISDPFRRAIPINLFLKICLNFLKILTPIEQGPSSKTILLIKKLKKPHYWSGITAWKITFHTEWHKKKWTRLQLQSNVTWLYFWTLKNPKEPHCRRDSLVFLSVRKD